MNSALVSSLNPPSSLLHFTNLKTQDPSSLSSLKMIKASSDYTHNHPIIRNLKNFTKAAIFIGVTATMAGKFPVLPAKAETPATITNQTPTLEEEGAEAKEREVKNSTQNNIEAIEYLKALLQQKLDNGEDDEALKILKGLVSAQPSVIEWKFLMARLLNEAGQTENARNVFEEILAVNPLSFEALFENALLMDRRGEGEAVIRRLQEALDIAEEENKVKEARDVRLIMAQIQFLQKNVEEALKSYQELSKEDPSDFRPYFCQGMIYSLLDRNEEAREQFAKYRELSPKKFEVEGYLRTPLSRMKLFGPIEKN